MKKLFAKNSWLLTIMILFSLAAFSPIIARAQDGSLDPSFNPSPRDSFLEIDVMARQPDGKILIGGGFIRVVGNVVLRELARLNADGSIDLSFHPQVSSGTVSAIALQPDGKIIIGGNFSYVNDIARTNIARLNSDGTSDASFDAGTFVFFPFPALALQPDGKILIGGSFLDNGVTSHLARLNANGSLDSSFNPGEFSIGGYVNAIELQPDGKVIIGGDFTTIGGITQNRIARLNANGSLDASFNPSGGVNQPVNTIALQPDGKIIIGGEFTLFFNGLPRSHIARLNANGSVDASFDPGSGFGGFIEIRTTELQADGKVLIGGNFSSFNGVTRYSFARLNSNGSLDISFNPQTSAGVINSLLIQPDGKIVIGGVFSINSSPLFSVARLLNSIIVTNLTTNVSLNEGNSGTTAFNFTVNLSAASTQTVTVNYQTADGTATASIDYQATSGLLTFAPGETSKTVTVMVNGDTAVEPNETFTVNLSGATNATITGGIGTGTIVNDDICAYSISPTSLNINAAGGAGNTITVTAQTGCAYTATSNNSFITINSGTSGSGNGTVVFTVDANAGAARTGTIIVAGQTFTVNQAASPTFRKTPFDFDGDGRADVSVYRPSNGTWYLSYSTAGFPSTLWGNATDKIVPADYDGDGKTNIAVYRPSNGIWFILNADNSYYGIQWGIANDKVVSADYDGDGKANIAVYRPSNGMWYILNADGSYYSIQFGVAIDIPVPADYDGDGKADTAVFRPNTGVWYLLQTTAGFAATQWGGLSDKPVAADYDGDGKADIGIFRPSNGTWYFLNSTAGFSAIQWGIGSDIPIPANN